MKLSKKTKETIVCVLKTSLETLEMEKEMFEEEYKEISEALQEFVVESFGEN